MANIWKSTSLLFLITIQSIMSAHAQELHDQKITGNVKQVTTYMYNGKIDPKYLEWKAVQKYNTNSKITEYNHYRRNGKLEFRDIYHYNDKGLLSRDVNEEAGDAEETEYKYDSSGNLVELKSFDVDGKLEYRFTYKVNAAGQQIEENIFGKDDILKSRSAHTYDKNGNNVETKVYDSLAKLTRIWRHTYDSKKNLTENSHYGPDDKLIKKSTTKYIYYPSGVIKNESNYEDGQITSKESFDLKGNVVESIMYSGIDDKDFLSKEMTKYNKFDSKGNWLQTTRTMGPSHLILMVREIAYY